MVYLSTDSHPSKHLIATRPRVEPTTSKSNVLIATSPRHHLLPAIINFPLFVKLFSLSKWGPKRKGCPRYATDCKAKIIHSLSPGKTQRHRFTHTRQHDKAMQLRALLQVRHVLSTELTSSDIRNWNEKIHRIKPRLNTLHN